VSLNLAHPVVQWCNMNMYNIYTEVLNRQCWSSMVWRAVDTNGH